jgi:hypothetical protein
VAKRTAVLGRDRPELHRHPRGLVGFGFTYLLNFRRLPRLKNIGKARLYRPRPGEDTAWPQLDPVLSTKTIEWDLIAQQYDQTAPRLRPERLDRPRQMSQGMAHSPRHLGLRCGVREFPGRLT